MILNDACTVFSNNISNLLNIFKINVTFFNKFIVQIQPFYNFN